MYLPMRAETLKLQPGQEGYEEVLNEAADRLLGSLERELRGLYERHRHVLPGWEDRPLIIH
jgi:hypothetical protein